MLGSRLKAYNDGTGIAKRLEPNFQRVRIYVRYTILAGLIITFSLVALAVNPREDFYDRILNSREEIGPAAFHSGYNPTPLDRYFYYTFLLGESRGEASTHSGFYPYGPRSSSRYKFIESVMNGQHWTNAVTNANYTPTEREVFFLLIRDGYDVRSASDNSRYVPTKADLYYYRVYIQKEDPGVASANTGFTPKGWTRSLNCALFLGIQAGK